MTAIEWTDATWNPVTGCSKVSPGCANCYAETLSLRFGWSTKPWTPENAVENVVLHPDRLDAPLRWRKPRRVFVCSMSDLFHERVPDDFIHSVFQRMERVEQHTFQVLTKRPERARDLLRWLYTCVWCEGTGCPMCNPHDAPRGMKEPLLNVWVGVSIENARYTWRADVLREIPAAVRFISAEPLLGSLFPSASDTRRPPSNGAPGRPGLTEPDRGASAGAGGEQRALVHGAQGDPATVASTDRATVRGHNDSRNTRASLDLTGIDWLICGGESGHGARPMQPEWARELRDACTAHGTAFFFKQWGGRTPKSGGRLLDGREWNEMPV